MSTASMGRESSFRLPPSPVAPLGGRGAESTTASRREHRLLLPRPSDPPSRHRANGRRRRLREAAPPLPRHPRVVRDRGVHGHGPGPWDRSGVRAPGPRARAGWCSLPRRLTSGFRRPSPCRRSSRSTTSTGWWTPRKGSSPSRSSRMTSGAPRSATASRCSSAPRAPACSASASRSCACSTASGSGTFSSAGRSTTRSGRLRPTRRAKA